MQGTSWTRTRKQLVRGGTVVAAAVALAGLATSTSAAGSGFRVTDVVDVAVNPFGDTIGPNGATVWIANSGTTGETTGGGPAVNGHTVTVLDTRTHRIRSVIDVGRFPEDIAFTHAGRQALVTNSTDGTVSVIDTTTRRVTQTVDLSGIPLTFPFGIIGVPHNHKVFVTSVGEAGPASIAVLDDNDPANVTIADTINLAGFAGRPALTPDERLLVVPFGTGDGTTPRVALIDTRTDRVVDQLSLPGDLGAAQAATVTPDGRFAYVSIFNETPGGAGEVWVIDLARRATSSLIQTPDPAEEGSNASPDGRFVFVTDFLLNEVSVISTVSRRVVATIPVGAQPNETAFSPNGHTAFVTNQGDTSVSVITVP